MLSTGLLFALTAVGDMKCGNVHEFDAGAPEGDQMQRIDLPTAKCIDGSPAVYYVAANTSSSKYVFWLEGGGACQGFDDCVSRAKTDLGSSTKYPQTRTATRGMLTSSKALNPDFAEWNRVYVPYCTGDIFAGQDTVAKNPWLDQRLPKPAPLDSTWTGYFDGHTHIKEVIDAVKTRHGGDSATEVILSGCSAGGIGTFLNCDYTAELFPKARAACRPEGGWFGLPLAREKDWKEGKDSDDMHNLNGTKWAINIDLWSLKSMPAVQACLEDTKNASTIPFCDTMPPMDGWTNAIGCCGSAPYFFPYMKTPVFISQNTMDAYQISVQGGGSPTNVGYVKYVQEIIAGSLSSTVINGAKKDENGLFASACYQHCPIPWSGKGAPEVDGENDMQRFGDWYFGRVPKDKNMNLDNSTNPLKYLACAVRD